VNFTADVSLLPAGIREDLARELIALVETDPSRVAEQIRAWIAAEELV
jgi:flagellar biosynthesis/type III secretory pathway M-ring protein FliF/YscJ